MQLVALVVGYSNRMTLEMSNKLTRQRKNACLRQQQLQAQTIHSPSLISSANV